MVGGLHRDGLRVVLDQVFNHTPASGQARHLRARPDRARLLPAARRRRRGADLDLLPERRHRARHGPEDHGRLGRVVGAQLQGRRVPVRPHGAPQQGQHAGRACRAGPADAGPGRCGRRARSTCTARAGTSARWRTTPCSPRPPRATSAARGSAPSPTGCATPCAVAARSTTTRASRASAAASPTDPNGAAVNDGAAASLAHDTDLVQLGLAGNLKAFTFKDSGRQDGAGRPGRLQRRARRLRRPAGRGRSATSTPTTTRPSGTR